MSALGKALTALAGLLFAGSLGCWLAAIWSTGQIVQRFGLTGVVLLTVGVLTAALASWQDA